MSSVFEFEAVNRAKKGTGAAKATRRGGEVPAVVYGGSAEPEHVTLNLNEVTKSLVNEAVYSHVLQLVVDGKSQNVILKDMQRHPAKETVLHMDFMRINMNEKIKVHVPLHFTNEAESLGVKAGGVVTHTVVEIEISCLPGVLPEYIEVDMAEIEIGGSVHLTDIVVPEGIEILALTHGEDHNLPVAQIMLTRSSASDDEEVAAVADEDAAAE